MYRIILTLLLILAPAGLLAQRSLLLRDPLPVAAVSSYTGPLDVVSGGVVWYAVDRCGSGSYAGNVADIWDSATGSTTETLVTCTAGGVIHETINALATTCSGGCRVKTLYDQVGTNCSGGACNLTQATNASRPTATANALGSKYCATLTASTTMAAAAGTQIAQGWTGSTVGEGTGTAIDLLNGEGGVNGNAQLIMSGTSAQQDFFAGSVANFTATGSAFHAIQWIANGASSNVYVDGSSTSVSPGTDPVGTAIGMNNQQTGAGVFCEGGFWSGNFNSTQQANMNTNQHGSTNNGWNF